MESGIPKSWLCATVIWGLFAKNGYPEGGCIWKNFILCNTFAACLTWVVSGTRGENGFSVSTMWQPSSLCVCEHACMYVYMYALRIVTFYRQDFACVLYKCLQTNINVIIVTAIITMGALLVLFQVVADDISDFISEQARPAGREGEGRQVQDRRLLSWVCPLSGPTRW